VQDQFLAACQNYDEIWLTCVTPWTIVETLDGPMEIEKLNVGDLVISGNGVPEQISDKRVMNHCGDMIRMVTRNGQTLEMTPWHRLYVRKVVSYNPDLKNKSGYSLISQKEGEIRDKRKTVQYLVSPPEYIQADQIQEGDFVCSVLRDFDLPRSSEIHLSKYLGPKWRVDPESDLIYSSSTFSRSNTNKTWPIKRDSGIRNSLALTEDISYLFGVYAAEGSHDGNSISFAMHESERDILEKLQDILFCTFGLSSKIRCPGNPKSLELRCSNRLLCDFFSMVFNSSASTKKVPDFIFYAPLDIMSAFLRGIFEGDGYVSKNAINLRVCSKKLRDGCASLLMNLNLLPSFGEDYNLRFNSKWNIQQKHPAFTLRVGGKQFVESNLLGIKKSTKTGNRSYNNHLVGDDGLWHKVKNVTTFHYEGPIVDITVCNDNTFCVQSVLSHNSEWSASILRKYLPDRPIYAIKTGVDTSIYTEEGDRFDFKPNIKGFVFLSVFAWNYRKGPDVLCKAYFDEFSQADDVSLLIMSRYQSGRTRHHREKIRLDIDKYMESYPNKDMPHVVRFNQMLPESDMPKLYRAADAFILTTRGEGGGLPPLEASLCGLPIIMTNCSGQQGYLRDDNAYMIDIDRIAPVQPGQMHLHYWDGHEFPQLTSPSVHDQVKQHMRRVYENQSEARQRNRKMQQLIHQEFTWTHTANAAIERLKEINKKLKG